MKAAKEMAQYLVKYINSEALLVKAEAASVQKLPVYRGRKQEVQLLKQPTSSSVRSIQVLQLRSWHSTTRFKTRIENSKNDINLNIYFIE
jgi:hypothetical protein